MDSENRIVFNIDDMLERRKMKLVELSRQVGISLANLSIMKNGKTRAIRLSTLEKLCEALDCQPGDLFSFMNEEEHADAVQTVNGSEFGIGEELEPIKEVSP
ncbi:MAG: helix-turn-helix transcriptional regulator [Clostridia bacterium]|nr:helix-turn-helix transcriptional regulator [Clostridia bacterium]